MSNLLDEMKMELTNILAEAAKILGGGTGGAVVGYWAQKQAAKSEAVKELQLLKLEYKDFAEFTRDELSKSRQERIDCQKENAKMREKINGLNLKVNDLTIAIHNAIGTPKDKRKGLNGD